MNTVASWNKQVGRRRFVYTVKVCELITHLKRFVGTKSLVQDFGFIADQLAERMGCFLFQLPPSYHYTPSRLKSIVNQLDPARRNVVEFRHGSWWDKKVFAAFRESGITFCSCSGPRLPDTLVKTSDVIYVRFHGTSQWYRHNYSKDELAAWALKIRRAVPSASTLTSITTVTVMPSRTPSLFCACWKPRSYAPSPWEQRLQFCVRSGRFQDRSNRPRQMINSAFLIDFEGSA